ncbi:SIS domain-containing protein [Lichenifustis flavocetrariae]|uniref:Glutamine--fructose-6-phosphate aminotransferase [isomerizing] n=1 Tax=Lichenifustis flavocetrariae TaxID=2949735 RepID=A0AA42CKI3_9HYPH|nr:SIS domain-containing protein [Lichenifustis flavocetrariae]MCW6510608.1 SIS domain-containing protein [Lichenifustis flavocetrariae]
MQNEKEVMLKEVALQPGFVRDNIDPMLAYMREVVAGREPGTLRHGFMIGCGDSFSAALAARSYMMKATGRFIEPVEALEFSRYLVTDLPPDSFVFGISNSGTVSRTIEGVRLARDRGAWTFAVTVSADTNLARAAETLIKVNAPPNIKEQPDGTKVITPGSVTYTASMLGLFTASIAVGECIGYLGKDRVEQLLSELRAVPDAMSAADATVSDLAPKIAATFTKDRKTVILGAGPNYGTAYFGMCKWFEGLTRPCHYAELEEWAHEQYFFTDEMTDTIILLPPGASRDRGLEQAQASREMGSRIIIIGRAGDAEAEAASDIYFAMPDLPETLTPFVYKLPFEYLSCHIADQQNIAFLGFDNKRRQEVNFRQIFHSAQAKAAPEVATR